MLTGTTQVLCGYCGRPMATSVVVGHMMYHAECVRGPHQVEWPLTEDRVRQIVREELVRIRPPEAA